MNVPNIRQVLHYGALPDLESYLQELGRRGRDGKPCKVTLYYRPFHLAHCDEHMRNFWQNIERKCRRKILMSYFKEKPETPDLKHVMFVRQPTNAAFAVLPKHLTQPQ